MPRTLPEWLDFIQAQHPSDIEFGLDRARVVFNKLFPDPWHLKTITVAGTNGKGTTVAMLESLALAHDLSVVTFTSPHLFDYRERVRHNSELLQSDMHAQAFAAVHAAAMDTQLTYFEYSTLAALWLAQKLSPDIVVLEVGLGGRLDVVNVVCADIVVLTTVDYDHQEYLGDTIEQIAEEKLGVVHKNTQLILADQTVPKSCLDKINARAVYSAGVDYSYDGSTWCWPKLGVGPWPVDFYQAPYSNPAAAVAAFCLLDSVALDAANLATAAQQVKLPGRFQQISQLPPAYVDVAHNPQAVAHLVRRPELNNENEVYVVLGMLADKNIHAVLTLLNSVADQWYLCDLDNPRSWSVAELSPQLGDIGISLTDVTCYASVLDAYSQAIQDAERTQASIIVLGSFHTVGPILELISKDVE